MTRTSKTLIPAVSPLTIARGLEDRLEEALTRRLTTVVAGAGFGKTTLLASWCKRVGGAWYTIDRRDRTLATLAYGLAVALRRRVPRLPPYLLEVPSRPGGGGSRSCVGPRRTPERGAPGAPGGGPHPRRG